MKKFTLILIGVLFVSTVVFGQQKQLTLKLNNVTVKEALEAIKTIGGYSYWFDARDLNITQRISLNVVNRTIDDVLALVFKGQKVEYKIKNGNIVISKSILKETPQKKTEIKRVSGIVLDERGEPVIGASVLIPESNISVITDLNGKFTVDAPIDSKIHISYIGYESQEQKIKESSNLRISLSENPKNLNEVVVVGYGRQKKATITGAIASVESEKLLQSPVANISNALVGRVSGLLSTQASGAPGIDGSTLRIRGIGTFSGTSDPLVIVDGIEVQNYNNIDPNEIDNISVLKDASATAVYGVRGANGVVIITTKRGKVGKPQISYTSQFAVSTFANIRHYAGSAEYAAGYNEALKYDSYLTGVYQPKYSESDIQHYKSGDDPLFYPNTDWVKVLFKPYTTQTQHNLNVSGGTEKVKYFLSFGYFDQGGLYNEKAYNPGYDAKNEYTRYNFRSNFDFNITKRLTAKFNISTQIEEIKGIVGDRGANTQSPGFLMASIFAAPPTLSPGIWDGKIVNTVTTGFYTNPFGAIFGNGMSKNYNNSINGLLRFNYDLDFLTKGLSTHLQIAYQNLNSVSSMYLKPVIQYWAINLGGGDYVLAPQNQDSPYTYSETYGKRRKQDAEFGLDYSRTIGDHNIGGLLIYTQTKTYDPNLAFLVPNGYQGLVGRVTYDYKRRYLAEFNAGYNGTENFAPGKRFGFFPACSLGWVVSEEPLFPKNDIVSFLKFRGSYGEVGNDKIGGDRFLYRPTSYEYSGVYYFGEVGSTYSPYNRSNEGKIGNPDVSWERAKKLDVGLDLSMFKDKLRITLDYFNEKRDNILANRGTIPNIIGATLPAYNFGRMENGGWDGEINYYGKVGNSFNYWIKGILTLTHNVILFQDEVKRTYAYQSQTNQRYGQVFGFIAEGVYNTWQEVNDANRPVSSFNSNKIQPGDFKYKDVNGDGIIDQFDMVPIGYSAFPEKTFGFSFGFDYKGFDVSVLFQGATDYSHLTSKKFNRGWQEDGSAVSFLLDRSWTWEKYAAGIATDFPHISSSASQNNNYQTNTFWLEDASFLRLKNIEIGYTFKSGLINKLGLSSVRIYLTGNNIYTWDKLLPGEDPDIPTYDAANNEPYPITKTFNGGLSVKF